MRAFSGLVKRYHTAVFNETHLFWSILRFFQNKARSFFSMHFPVAKALKVRKAVVGIHILCTNAYHGTGKGAAFTAVVDIVIAQVLCRLHTAQRSPVCPIGLVEKPRLGVVHLCPQGNRSLWQANRFAVVGKILEIALHHPQDAAVPHLVPCHIRIDPVTGIIIQDQPGHLLEVLRSEIQRGFCRKVKALPPPGKQRLTVMAGQGLSAI